jgi:hypothetical protein
MWKAFYLEIAAPAVRPNLSWRSSDKLASIVAKAWRSCRTEAEFERDRAHSVVATHLKESSISGRAFLVALALHSNSGARRVLKGTANAAGVAIACAAVLYPSVAWAGPENAAARARSPSERMGPRHDVGRRSHSERFRRWANGGR